MRANWERITEIVTPIYEKILLEAVKEQGIQCELLPNTSTGKLDLVLLSDFLIIAIFSVVFSGILLGGMWLEFKIKEWWDNRKEK